MSSLLKCMECHYCRRNVPIQEGDFPEDLYDLIQVYNVKQLFWICKYCFQPTSSVSQLCSGQKNIEQKLTNLAEHVRLLTDEIRSQSRYCPASNVSCSSVNGIEGISHNIGQNQVDDNNSGFESSSEKDMKISTASSIKASSALSYMHAILNSIKITKQEERSSNAIITVVLDNLLNSLKKDPDFSCVFNRFYYTGSAYNDLRITSATEYDINLVLRLPNKISMTVEFFDTTYAFGKLKLQKYSDISVPVEKFLKYCTSDGYLVPKNVLSWLQRHVDEVLRNRFKKPDEVIDVRSIQNGPAKTIVISTASGCCINVDLVPVFEFDFAALAGTPFLNSLLEITQDTTKQKWFMVPKGCIGEIDLTLSEANYSWRLDFPETEKIVLYQKGCSKPVIKILKLLRNKQNWKDLASYYLKTIVLLKVLENSSEEYWANHLLFERLLEVLKKLKSHLDDHHLPHFITKNNLFHKMNTVQCSNWSNYLQKLISSIQTNSKMLSNYFV